MLTVENAKYIEIVSGEGDGEGTAELYLGKRSARALKARLTRERCGGDRWARAVMYSHESKYGESIGVEFQSGNLYSMCIQLDEIK